MEELDESIVLLSTMSPKVHKSKKNTLNRKVITKLSLKRNIRRSSIYDNLQPTIKTCDVELSDYTSTDSSTSSLVKKTSDTIVIIDESTEDECPLPVEKGLLSKSRYDSIENWIEHGTKETYSDDEEELALEDKSSNKVVRKSNDKNKENDLLSKYLGKTDLEESVSKSKDLPLKNFAVDNKVASNEKNENDLLCKYLGRCNIEKSSSKSKDSPLKYSAGAKTNSKVVQKSTDNENDLLDENNLEESSRDFTSKKLGVDKSNNKIVQKPNDINENDFLPKYWGKNNLEKNSNKSKDLPLKNLTGDKTNTKVGRTSNDKNKENDLLSKYLTENNLGEISSKSKDFPMNDKTNNKVTRKSNDKNDENDLLSKYLTENNLGESKSKDLESKNLEGNIKVTKRSTDKSAKCNENDLLAKYMDKNNWSKFTDSSSKTSGDNRTNKGGKELNDKITKSKENDLQSKYRSNLVESSSKFKVPTSKNLNVNKHNVEASLDDKNTTRYDDFSEYLGESLKNFLSSTSYDLVPDPSVRAAPNNQRTNSAFVKTKDDLVTDPSVRAAPNNQKTNIAFVKTKDDLVTDPSVRAAPNNQRTNSAFVKTKDDLVTDPSVRGAPNNQRTNSAFVKTKEGSLESKFIQNRKKSNRDSDNDNREMPINDEAKVSKKENKKNSIDLEFSTPAKPVGDEQEVASFLDELYGKGWRTNEHKVLSEKKVKPRKKENVKLAKTEVKPKKTQAYQTSEFDRRKQDVGKSPWLMKLKQLCDTESEGSLDEDENNFQIKQKLQFDDCEDSDSSDSTSSDKSSNDFSDVGVTLPDKTKGKRGQKINTKKSTKENKSLNINKVMPPPLSNQHNKKPIKKKIPVSKFHEISKILISDSDDSSDDLDLETKLKDKLNEVKTIMKTNHVDPKNSKNAEEEEVMNNLDKLLHRISLQAKPTTKSSTKPVSFLQSLSKNVPLEKCELSVRICRKNFRKHRDELLQRLFKLYNTDIFDKCMPDDVPIEWSDKMTRTAGYCACKKITRRTGAIERSVRFVLSSKVLDSPDRLRDTLVHEMCHAATWIVDKVSNGHGAYWKAWAIKAMKIFPELPPIKTCHDYTIHTKFTYKCIQCGYSFGRHSKSLDITKKCCGICRGKFEVLLNKKSKNGDIKAVPVEAKKAPTGFALFVKENYGNYKTESLKHRDVMQILGKKFSEMKVGKT